ncbi:peptidoglycan DD-metalloendopeptidase family protein [Devosia sp. XJ19-1]|uniref:Peptidoglycan DD-metalloendopeptidase family protein n=1 Tax=Devosia ureilytica TaxID=2952754 RepID=A0A9Q4ANM2_9HYPH|nr:peptidoglycan DD-metalloendopeptidase family protein [Devosia ureilytica]MCP8882755.1 peptidoglycan DD-metalloendopeptidase family protein [Devosia ureilytica]MCP8886877.1 peptidoglycan DD-metalloendopeptidase family protein [Devosia ureilytica]
MPLRPASIVKALLAGSLLTGLAAWPLLAQTETAAPPAQDVELRPALPIAPLDATEPETSTPTVVEDVAAEPANANVIDLEEVEASLGMSRERIDALKAEIAAMEGDRTQQNAALIAAAQRVKLAEIEVADVEERISDLIVRELEVRGRLDGADTEIANVLAALERISLNPPPALIVDPDDALGSARGAMLIAAILPQLRDRADAVASDLKALTDIKIAALAEEQTLKANYDVLEEEQLRIATLIAARKQGITQMSAALEAEEAEAVALAERATSLRELIDALTERVANGANTAPTDPALPQLSPEAIELAFADAARTQPAVPFALSRGYLALPANGVTVVDFGANDGRGGIAQGQSVMTRAEAQVVAPADGWVLYKGPYLNYGQIVILNTGSGYTALLAGLEAITADIGQFVQMGEPLGTMGSRTSGRTVTTSAGNDQPTLYIELRQDNEPFDPAGWWASNEQTG